MKPSRSRMVCSASPVSGSDAHDLVEDVAELQARSSLRGPAFGVTGWLVRLRMGRLIDGRRSRACRGVGSCPSPVRGEAAAAAHGVG
jgi:hypothetical protein